MKKVYFKIAMLLFSAAFASCEIVDNDVSKPVENPNDSAVMLLARVNGYDIVISTADDQKLESPYQTLTFIFQCIWVSCLVLVFVFVFVILYSFYKSIKQGTVFQKN